MNATCARCKGVNPPGAMYCQSCGTPTGATMVQQRTMVMPEGAVGARLGASRGATATKPEASLASQPPPPAAAILDQVEDTVSVTDCSSSMAEEFEPGVTKLQAAGRAQINMLLQKYQIDPRDRFSLVCFNTQADVRMPLYEIGSNKKRIIEKIQSLQAGGGTDIDEGLSTAGSVHDWSRSDVVRRIVLLTDGHGGHPLRTAANLKKKGVVIDVIGIGPSPADVDEELLRKIASVVQGELRYRFIKDHKALVQHYTQLANKTRTGV